MPQQRQPRKRRKPEFFTTEVFGLVLTLHPGRPDHVGFRFRTPEGRETTRWVRADAEVIRMIRRKTDPHTEQKERLAAMTEAEKAELFKETGGGS